MSSTPPLHSTPAAASVRPFAAVLFDLDGTLLHTAPDLINACQATLQHFGYPEAPRENIARCVTSGMRVMLRASIAPAAQDAALIEGPMRDYFAQYYTEHICTDTRPFPGMNELLLRLKADGIKCAVVTNKYHNMAVKLLQHFPLYPALSLILGCDSCTHAKPHPEPLLTACRTLGVQPVEALYVGDHLNDMEAARRAGCPSCCALWGYGAVECGDPSGWQSTFAAADCAELERIIHSGRQIG